MSIITTTKHTTKTHNYTTTTKRVNAPQHVGPVLHSFLKGFAVVFAHNGPGFPIGLLHRGVNLAANHPTVGRLQFDDGFQFVLVFVFPNFQFVAASLVDRGLGPTVVVDDVLVGTVLLFGTPDLVGVEKKRRRRKKKEEGRRRKKKEEEGRRRKKKE